MQSGFSVVIHGSLRKHLFEMERAHRIFRDAGIEVLAPQFSEIVKEEDGFSFVLKKMRFLKGCGSRY